MKQIMKTAAILAMLASAPSWAALQSIHWKANGDNLVTLDTATGKEWLDLSRTDNMSYNQVSSLLSTTFAGWRFATADEVHTMMSNQFPQVASYSDTPYYVRNNTLEGASREMATGKQFREMFGSTYLYWMSSQDWHAVSYGFYRDDNNGIRLSGFDRRNYWNGSYQQLYHNHITGSGDLNTWTNSYSGWYLVSDGGVSWSSLNNPALNQNNPDAPINQRPVGGSSIASLITGTVYADLELVYNGTSNFVGYKYKVNGGAEQTVTGNRLNITGLTEGTRYTIEYAAYNSNGTGEWYSTTVTTEVSAPLMAMSGFAMLLMGFRRSARMRIMSPN